MGRLKLQMQITIDGFNPDNEDDDLVMDEVRDYSRDLLDSADSIILGRKTAGDLIPYWDDKATRPTEPWYEVAKRISSAKKVVFSRTLTSCPWNNTEIDRGGLAEGVNRLKKTGTKDIIVYGGVSFVSSLVGARLIDEFHLFINPVALGKGKSIFTGLENKLSLRLVKSIRCDSGHVLLHYESIVAQ